MLKAGCTLFPQVLRFSRSFERLPAAFLFSNTSTMLSFIFSMRTSGKYTFYKTLHGAEVGDLFMSLIHTCNLVKANPFDYLVALQEHASDLAQHPENWMPWNYQSQLSSSE